jgi:hypothetical protein
VEHLRNPDVFIAAGRVLLSIPPLPRGRALAELDLAAKVNELLNGWPQAATG